jgi:hypothetical protein
LTIGSRSRAEARHELGNLAAFCSRCNSMKGMLSEAEFWELLTLSGLLHRAAHHELEVRLLAGGRRHSR